MSESLVAAVLDRRPDPAEVFAVCAAESEHAFWLDAGPAADAGWSWVGVGEPEPEPLRVRSVRCDDRHAAPWPAGRFRGGWVGWLGYDDAAARGGAPRAVDDVGVPLERWLRVRRFVAFDHATGRAWAVADAAVIDDWRARVSRPPSIEPATAAPVSGAMTARARHTSHEYAALIERCRDAIRDGDAYQLCLTTRFEVYGRVDPAAVYARLRTATPAHHGALIRSAQFALGSASPERFLEVDAGVVRTRPIKGTRPRGVDAASDAALADELRSSAKERAENVMIVDLMRNDLSRVCRTATVAVEDLLTVESYPAVHQLVSTVSGTLRDGTTVGALLDATFPAGSMTGAPKLSAMTILHDLEGAARGVFAGCFGWVGEDGALDLAMVIRSIVFHQDGAYVGAGGGITWRSDAAAEVAEVGVKARGPLTALGADLPEGW